MVSNQPVRRVELRQRRPDHAWPQIREVAQPALEVMPNQRHAMEHIVRRAEPRVRRHGRLVVVPSNEDVDCAAARHVVVFCLGGRKMFLVVMLKVYADSGWLVEEESLVRRRLTPAICITLGITRPLLSPVLHLCFYVTASNIAASITDSTSLLLLHIAHHCLGDSRRDSPLSASWRTTRPAADPRHQSHQAISGDAHGPQVRGDGSQSLQWSGKSIIPDGQGKPTCVGCGVAHLDHGAPLSLVVAAQ